MTNGTTGIQVTPIAEDEMRHVQTIIQRAFDGVIAMSQLAADVDMLRETVQGLQRDMDRLRSQNNALEEALEHSRRTRTEQAEQIGKLKSEFLDMRDARDNIERRSDTEAEVAANTIKTLTGNVQGLSQQLDKTFKERDDAEFKVAELEDSLEATRAKLSTLEAAFASVFSKPVPIMEEAKPNPFHETEPPYEAPPEPKGPVSWQGDPNPPVNVADYSRSA